MRVLATGLIVLALWVGYSAPSSAEDGDGLRYYLHLRGQDTNPATGVHDHWGLSLGAMMFESGLAKSIGEAIFTAMPVGGLFGIVLAATLMAVVVSEMTSNTASASLVVPVVLALAQAAGVDPLKPALAATVACSFGFMLPVSTPPNALVYATGRVKMHEMSVYGMALDAAGVLLVAGWVTWLG